MRKLASIQKINNLSPIPGADKIELAHVLGWQVIVKKDEFKVGDLCVYIEIDSLLPEKPEFEFLRSKSFKIKTMKMHGVVSQGICFPLSILPTSNYKEADDVTKILNIKKYNEEEEVISFQENRRSLFKFFLRYKIFRILFSSKEKKKGFPSWIKKTDEERIQTIPNLLKKYENEDWEISEKLDGTSATYGLKRNNFQSEFVICSRNLKLKNKDNYYHEMAEKYDIEYSMREYLKKRKIKKIVLQGEIIGPNIQKNKYNLKQRELYIFNVIINDERKPRHFVQAFCKTYGLNSVPYLHEKQKINSVEEAITLATGKSTLLKRNREGIVCRLINNPSISFKAINPEFLLEEK